MKKAMTFLILILLLISNFCYSQIYRCSGCSAEIKPGWEECPRCGEDLTKIDWSKLQQEQKEGKKKDGLINRFSVGLNYPGLSFKYISKELIGAEAKVQISNVVKVFGGRIYKYFNISKKFDFLYIGGEFGYILFTLKDTEIEGEGFCGSLFLGYEKVLFRHLGLSLDIGPVYTSIQDKEYKQKDQGFDFVLNIGLNFYF